MARVRKLTADGDLSYAAGRQELVEASQAEAQAVRIAVSTLKGENLYHPTFGIDVSGLSSGDATRQAAVIRAAIVRSGRIQGVPDIHLESRTGKARRAEYTARAVLRNGEPFDFGVSI